MGDDNEGKIARLLRVAAAGALTGGVAGAPAGVESALAGAVGGSIVAVGTELHSQNAPDERVARASAVEVEAASLRVAEMAVRLDAVTNVAAQLVAALGELRAERVEQRTESYAKTLLALVQAGHVHPDDFEREETREALVDTLRASVESLSAEAVPMLARLSARPIDHFTRGVCRLLVELDAGEVAELRELITPVAQALPHAGPTTIIPPDADRFAPLMFDPKLDAHPNGEIELYGLDDGLVWHVGEGIGVALHPESEVLARLIVHRVASAARARRRTWDGNEDRRVLRMTASALLDLHFVLTGEKIGATTSPAPTPSDDPA